MGAKVSNEVILELRLRLMATILAALLNVAFLLIGASMPLDTKMAKSMFESMEEYFKRSVLSKQNAAELSLLIFLHNSARAIPMAMPLFGVLWSALVLFTTGMAYNAILTVTGLTTFNQKVSKFIELFSYDYAIAELIAYSILTGESIVFYILFRRGKAESEVTKMLIVLLLAFVILALASYMESIRIIAGGA